MATIAECSDCTNTGFFPTEYKENDDEYHFECAECGSVLIIREQEEQ